MYELNRMFGIFLGVHDNLHTVINMHTQMHDSNSLWMYAVTVGLWHHWSTVLRSCERPIPQIPQCTCPISHNTPFRTEMCTFLFWMVYCGIWDRCIVGFVRLVNLSCLIGHIPEYIYTVLVCVDLYQYPIREYSLIGYCLYWWRHTSSSMIYDR